MRSSSLLLILLVIMCIEYGLARNVVLRQTRRSEHDIKFNTVHKEFIDKINEYRRAYGRKPLCTSAILTLTSWKKSFCMARTNSFHHSCGNKKFSEGIYEAGYQETSDVAENIAYNWDWSSHATVVQWMKSDAHRKNILNPFYTQVGVGVYQVGKTVWWTMQLGNGVDQCHILV